MLLKMTHETELTYSEPISETMMELRMAPRQAEDQQRLSFTLALGPPSSVMHHFDWLGNSVHAFAVNDAHQRVRIVATSVVRTDRTPADLAWLQDPWPLQLPAQEFTLYDFLRLDGPVADGPQLRALVAALPARDGAPVGQILRAMLDVIAEKFSYEKGATTVASPITDILVQGKGVCQDFAHLMIGMCRALGIPARYVCGLVHPDENRYRGATQTHAWVEVFVPSAGWLGVDPTNRCVVGDNFVTLGLGRDYRDVAPNRGVYRGKAREAITVTVQSERLRSVPGHLAAERFEAIALPTQAVDPRLDYEQTAQQQERQQQQEHAELHQQQQQQQQQ
jgi:transglutaminase-like putative cysteine protease